MLALILGVMSKGHSYFLTRLTFWDILDAFPDLVEVVVNGDIFVREAEEILPVFAERHITFRLLENKYNAWPRVAIIDTSYRS
jgi:hypothetical protein